MNLSIVSGTYNRLDCCLPRMVKSVRKSVGPLTYEIILVDGGSTDGTIKWCKQQGDVTLIEQGELLGGVKAFNAGCKAAEGDYVVILNDDIEVVGDTIQKSYEYLEQNPAVAQVAYKNNAVEAAAYPRSSLEGHYGYLYGQCCITRRWAGDVAGWWGNEGLHTYGGDSRLGMRLWELGFRVDALEGCKIVDYVVDDQFRRDRVAMLRPGGSGAPHHDTQIYLRHWRDRLPKPKKEKWIPAPPSSLSRKAARKQLRSIRFRFARQGMMRMSQLRAFRKLGPSEHYGQNLIVKEVGLDGFQRRAVEIVNDFRPDVVVFQAHGAQSIQPETIEKLRRLHPQTHFVNFDGDLHYALKPIHFELARAAELQCLISPDLFPVYIESGANRVAWWFPATEDCFVEAGANRPPAGKLAGPDVVSLMNRTPSEVFPEGQTRNDVVRSLIKSGLQFEVYGVGWEKRGVKSSGSTYHSDKDSAELYRTAKMALSISQSKDLWGYTSNRAFFIGATGCPMLCQRFRGMEALGYVDGETVIAWSDFDEMYEKIDYFLKHKSDREAIGQRCRELTLSRHTYDQRLQSLIAMLEYGDDHLAC